MIYEREERGRIWDHLTLDMNTHLLTYLASYLASHVWVGMKRGRSPAMDLYTTLRSPTLRTYMGWKSCVLCNGAKIGGIE